MLTCQHQQESVHRLPWGHPINAATIATGGKACVVNQQGINATQIGAQLALLVHAGAVQIPTSAFGIFGTAGGPVRGPRGITIVRALRSSRTVTWQSG